MKFIEITSEDQIAPAIKLLQEEGYINKVTILYVKESLAVGINPVIRQHANNLVVYSTLSGGLLVQMGYEQVHLPLSNYKNGIFTL